MTTTNPLRPRQTSLLDSIPEPAAGTRLRRDDAANRAVRSAQSSAPAATPPPVRFVDHFAGIGGFRLALEKSGARCVFASEPDGYTRATYRNNFAARDPEFFQRHRFARDITIVAAADVPEHDIVTATLPGQSFPHASRGSDFDAERDAALSQLARLIAHGRPRGFIFEDDAGLRFYNSGATFASIRETMTCQLGYSFHTAVLRPCDYGLPLLRPRLFMVGFRDPSASFAFPTPIPLKLTLSKVLGRLCDREVADAVPDPRSAQHFDSGFGTDRYLVNGREHQLTIRQAAMLHGFPDDFRFPAQRRRALRQIRSAVAIPVAAAIAREVVSALRSPHYIDQEDHS